MTSLLWGGLGSSIYLVVLLDPGRWRACIVKRLAGPNVLPGFSSWQALPVRPVVLGAQCRSRMVTYSLTHKSLTL